MSERVVQCHGCFDLLHIGHIRHFEAAREHGDRLVVTITPDEYVNKGPGRPVFPAKVRAEAVAALKCVDEVRITSEPTAAEAIRQIRPAVFAKGLDYEGGIDPGERQALHDVGGELVITHTEKWSSTALLNRSGYTPEVEAYLAGIRAKYTVADVKGWLEKALALKVLVIGDAIRDEYVYLNIMGKSGKDPILAGKYLREESFAGGAQAVERHTRAVVDDSYVAVGDTVTVKRRQLEDYPRQKVGVEEYRTEPNRAYPDMSTVADVRDYDLVIVADYGHGVLTDTLIAQLGERAKFLAVNVQANAGNHGFNTISKYLRAKYVSLSERELRLDARDQAKDVSRLAWTAAIKRNATVLVTRGESGCLAVTGDGERSEAPALTTHAVDRTGAGDAVFAITACCAAVGMPLDLLTFMASIVGTQAVGIVGNARYIERESLHAAIEQALG